MFLVIMRIAYSFVRRLKISEVWRSRNVPFEQCNVQYMLAVSLNTFDARDFIRLGALPKS